MISILTFFETEVLPSEGRRRRQKAVANSEGRVSCDECEATFSKLGNLFYIVILYDDKCISKTSKLNFNSVFSIAFYCKINTAFI